MGFLSRTLRHGVNNRLLFWCQGCDEAHVIDVGPGGWSYNGDPVKPVISPSILVRGYQIVKDKDGRWTGEWIRGADGEPLPEVCHSFIGINGAQPGEIIFLSDCTHKLAGKTLPLSSWPERFYDAETENANLSNPS